MATQIKNAISDASVFGPLLEGNACNFRIWARADASVELVLETDTTPRTMPMRAQPNGMFVARVEDIGPGARYWFKIDGAGPFPDPASRFQPLGVHGPSEVVRPSSGLWTEDDFVAPELRELVIYELHVGTFTTEGTFVSAIEKLDGLKQLGINVIELMPVADFAGDRNWGYDGVSLYAPSHSYGGPEGLRRLILEVHRRDIAVCLDVVYNHLGPDGAYHSTFAPKFYSGKHKTPWGDGLNFDADGRDKVRTYFIESAVAWIRDYHVDALRADAIDTIQDESEPHFLTELTEQVHAAAKDMGRKVFLIAEDARNERKVVLPAKHGGHGFDAVWSDDFHHHMRHRLAGDSDGYYRDFDGAAVSIAKTINRGWFFTGQYAKHWGRHRGTDPDGLSIESRLFCIQNHDQIGNRAFGERLSTQISRPAYYAASALLLLSPEIPLLFMGQEWAADEPFLFFTNHHDELGRLVTEGRRKEFEHFAAFSDSDRQNSIPDPQAKETFLQSKLNWNAQKMPDHHACQLWYMELMQLRRKLLRQAEFVGAKAVNDTTIMVQWDAPAGQAIVIVALDGASEMSDPLLSGMDQVTSSEDKRFNIAPYAETIGHDGQQLKFGRAGAIVLANGSLVQHLKMDENER